MNDLETRFRRGVDVLDTGLPEHPDLATLRAGGRRLRTRRRVLASLVTATAALAVVVPVALLGGDAEPSGTVIASEPPAPDEGDGPREPSGDDMTDAVLAHLPAAVPGEDSTLVQYVVIGGDPPPWTLIFDWERAFELPDLVGLDLAVHRLPPGETRPDPCSVDVLYGECTSSRVPEGLLATFDAAQPPDGPADEWSRTVTLHHLDWRSDVTTVVTVTATASGATWEDAERLLPTRQTLADLVTDTAFRPPVRQGEDPPGDG